jgi:hypothetical protein
LQPGEVEEQESVESQSIMDSDDQLSDSDISQQLSSTSQSAKKVKSSTVRGKSMTPKTEKEWLHIASEFKEKWNFDHCIGAIDGKHILIKPPSDSGSECSTDLFLRLLTDYNS